MIEALETRRFFSAAPVASLLVPAYFYPVKGGAWDKMAAAAKSVPMTAILNPDSGPGTSADPIYASAIDELRGDGGHVIGYVHTSYGTRPLAAVEEEVAEYASFYQLDGIFIDEMANDSAHVSYYQALYAYIKSLNSNFEVIGNPGTDTQEAYLTTQTADVLVDFEDNQSAYKKATPASWVSKYDSQHFGNIIGKANLKNMHTDLALAQKRDAGFVYVTDQNLNNDKTAYDRLPTYWNHEVAAIEAENG